VNLGIRLAWCVGEMNATSPTFSIALLLMTMAACGPSRGRGAGPGESDGDADVDTDADADADADDRAPLTVRIVATTEPFDHDDGLAGQTALHARGGVRSLRLLRDADDPSPVTVFDHGPDVVETGYDDGDETVVAEVEIPEDLHGTFTMARLVQGYSRYTVDATLHDGFSIEPGVVDSVLVMSDDTTIDGARREAGEYDFRFEGASTSFEYDGSGWPVPPYSTTAGATAVVEDGEWAVYFPIDLEVAQGLAPGDEIVIVVNMDRSFRWTDVLTLGYEPGVFDVTRLSYEPVLRFGGNSFDLGLAGASR